MFKKIELDNSFLDNYNRFYTSDVIAKGENIYAIVDKKYFFIIEGVVVFNAKQYWLSISYKGKLTTDSFCIGNLQVLVEQPYNMCTQAYNELFVQCISRNDFLTRMLKD